VWARITTGAFVSQFCDARIIAESTTFHVHRTTLAHASPVFRNMLTSSMEEGHSRTIILPGKAARDIELLLKVIYWTETSFWKTDEEKNVGGEENDILSYHNVYILLPLADEFRIQSLISMCEKHLITRYCRYSIPLWIGSFALRNNLHDLANRCLKPDNISKLASSPRFSEMCARVAFYDPDFITRLTVSQVSATTCVPAAVSFALRRHSRLTKLCHSYQNCQTRLLEHHRTMRSNANM
jgi:hypothetical protein